MLQGPYNENKLCEGFWVENTWESMPLDLKMRNKILPSQHEICVEKYYPWYKSQEAVCSGSLHHQHRRQVIKWSPITRGPKQVYAMFTLKLFDWLTSSIDMAATSESMAAWKHNAKGSETTLGPFFPVHYCQTQVLCFLLTDKGEW